MDLLLEIAGLPPLPHMRILLFRTTKSVVIFAPSHEPTPAIVLMATRADILQIAAGVDASEFG